MANRYTRRAKSRRGIPIPEEELADVSPIINYSQATTAGISVATLSAESFATSDLSAAGAAVAILWNADGGSLSGAGTGIGTAAGSAIGAGSMSGTGSGSGIAEGVAIAAATLSAAGAGVASAVGTVV